MEFIGEFIDLGILALGFFALGMGVSYFLPRRGASTRAGILLPLNFATLGGLQILRSFQGDGWSGLTLAAGLPWIATGLIFYASREKWVGLPDRS